MSLIEKSMKTRTQIWEISFYFSFFFQIMKNLRTSLKIFLTQFVVEDESRHWHLRKNDATPVPAAKHTNLTAAWYIQKIHQTKIHSQSFTTVTGKDWTRNNL